MLARGKEILDDARAAQWAIPGFTTYTLESTQAICDAADATELPAIVQIGSGSFRASSLSTLSALALAAAQQARSPIGVHLDHSKDLDEIKQCVDLGYTSVMVDGSHLGFHENIEFTKAVVEYAHNAGVWVEAELGSLAGAEHSSTDVQSTDLTDPQQAEEFVARTGIDVLAAAVGTVHGFTSRPIHVDIDRIAKIAQLIDIPFALHGASGISDHDLLGAVHAGTTKVNINAELRRAYLGALRLAVAHDDDDVTEVQLQAVAAVAEVARNRLTLLAGMTDAHEKEDTR